MHSRCSLMSTLEEIRNIYLCKFWNIWDFCVKRISINNFYYILPLINIQLVSEIFAMSILYTNAQSTYVTQKHNQIKRLRKKGYVTKKKFLSQQVLKLTQKVFNRISLWQMSEYPITVIFWSERNFWFQHHLKWSFSLS